MRLGSETFDRATLLQPIEVDEASIKFEGVVKSIQLNAITSSDGSKGAKLHFQKAPNSQQRQSFQPNEPTNATIFACLGASYHQGEQFYSILKQFSDTLPPNSNVRILLAAVPYKLNFYLRDLVSTDGELPDFGDDDLQYPSVGSGSSSMSSSPESSEDSPLSINQLRKRREVKFVRSRHITEQQKLDRIYEHSNHPKYQEEVEVALQAWFDNEFVQAGLAALQRKGVNVIMDRIKFYYERDDYQEHFQQVLDMWSDESSLSDDFHTSFFMALQGFQDRLLKSHMKSEDQYLLPQVVELVSKIFMLSECAFFSQIMKDAQKNRRLPICEGQPKPDDIYYPYNFYPFTNLKTHYQAEIFMLLNGKVEEIGGKTGMMYGRILMQPADKKPEKIVKKQKQKQKDKKQKRPSDKTPVQENNAETGLVSMTSLVEKELRGQCPYVTASQAEADQFYTTPFMQQAIEVDDKMAVAFSLLLAARRWDECQNVEPRKKLKSSSEALNGRLALGSSSNRCNSFFVTGLAGKNTQSGRYVEIAPSTLGSNGH